MCFGIKCAGVSLISDNQKWIWQPLYYVIDKKLSLQKVKLIDNHIKNIVSLCKRYKVNRLFVFGSVLTDRFNDDSDIHLVVDFKKDEVEDYFDNYFDFKYSLQDLFGRKVDLIEEQSIKNPYFRKSVDSTKQLIYG